MSRHAVSVLRVAQKFNLLKSVRRVVSMEMESRILRLVLISIKRDDSEC